MRPCAPGGVGRAVQPGMPPGTTCSPSTDTTIVPPSDISPPYRQSAKPLNPGSTKSGEGQEQDRRKTGLIYHKVSVCPGTQQTRICLCTMPRHDPFDDPGLYVDLVCARRALLFDLGDLSRLAPLMFLRVSDVFVPHSRFCALKSARTSLVNLAGITTGSPSPHIEFLAANSPLVWRGMLRRVQKGANASGNVYVATQFRSRFSSAKSDSYKVHALVRILFAQQVIK
jgi:hypothetical protein